MLQGLNCYCGQSEIPVELLDHIGEGYEGLVADSSIASSKLECPGGKLAIDLFIVGWMCKSS